MSLMMMMMMMMIIIIIIIIVVIIIIIIIIICLLPSGIVMQIFWLQSAGVRQFFGQQTEATASLHVASGPSVTRRSFTSLHFISFSKKNKKRKESVSIDLIHDNRHVSFHFGIR